MKGKSSLLKKMMAMFLTAVLMIGMVVGAVPEEVHAEEGGFVYDDNGDGTVTITGYNGDETILNIPITIEGKTVTAIEASKIESGGNYTSGFSESITEVKIPSSVTSIGNGAFCYCSNLTTVTIPEGVTSIGEEAFYSCIGLATVTIPGSVTSIGENAFASCSGLTRVTISEGVGVETSIGIYAFTGCGSLTEVTIPGSVTNIGNGAFGSCGKLTTVTISEGVESIDANAFFNCGKLATVTIPSSVTDIGENAFLICLSLKSVTYGCCKKNWSSIATDANGLKNSQITVEYNVIAQEAKAATCTEEGYKEAYYECSGCHGAYSDPNGEKSITKPIIPAKGHTPADAVEENRVDATCAKEGSYDMVVYCSVCKAEISRTTKPIDKKAHSYGGWTVTQQPTESEEGIQERSCSVCGYKQTEVIPKTVSTGSGDSTGGGGNTGSGNNTGKIETEEEKGGGGKTRLTQIFKCRTTN